MLTPRDRSALTRRAVYPATRDTGKPILAQCVAAAMNGEIIHRSPELGELVGVGSETGVLCGEQDDN